MLLLSPQTSPAKRPSIGEETYSGIKKIFSLPVLNIHFPIIASSAACFGMSACYDGKKYRIGTEV